MASPPEITIKALNGKFVMNKSLSDEYDPLLELQGMGWFFRQAVKWATVTQNIKTYTSPTDQKPHIDIQQTVTGGIQASPEYRILDWTDRTHSDRIFGEVEGKSRYILAGDIPDAEAGGDKDWLCEGWDEQGEKVESWVRSKVEEAGEGEEGVVGWVALQVWGFAVVEEKRYFVRKVVLTKGPEKRRARLVYEYQGAAEDEEE